jgi:RNA recognition motif-containing protein
MKDHARHLLYIGNLSVITDKALLTNHLKDIADVLNLDIVLNDNSRSRRCFAIAEVATPAEVDRVIQKLNGTVFQGRAIRVRRKLQIIQNNSDGKECCRNSNHGRILVSVLFCPDCGERFNVVRNFILA